MIEIKDLDVCVADKCVLQACNLNIGRGELHILMGVNGAGKSTLAKVFAGDPQFVVNQGTIFFNGENILDKTPDERARQGLFVGFQEPPEIIGVSILKFLKEAYTAFAKALGRPLLTEAQFRQFVCEKLPSLGMKPELIQRGVNEGFSGGEKRRFELLQMLILQPEFAFLDEIDSGLDTDAQRLVADIINKMIADGKSILLITHNIGFLELLAQSHVHIMSSGRIIKSGGMELAQLLNAQGYGAVE